MAGKRIYNLVLLSSCLSWLCFIGICLFGYFIYRFNIRVRSSSAEVDFCRGHLQSVLDILTPSNIVLYLESDINFFPSVASSISTNIIRDFCFEFLSNNIPSSSVCVTNNSDDFAIKILTPLPGAYIWSVNGVNHLQYLNKSYSVGDKMRYGIISDILSDCIFFNDGESCLFIDSVPVRDVSVRPLGSIGGILK